MPDTLSKEDRAILEEVTWKDERRVGGALCFRGTRVPVDTLTGHLRRGHSLEYFLEGFPTVEREQAERFLDLAARMASGLAEAEEEMSGDAASAVA